MKRFSVVALVVGLLAAFACSQAAMAGKPAEQQGNKPAKVLVRHLAEVIPIDAELPDGPAVKIYRVIRISAKALDCHLAHGDLEAEEGDVKGDVIVIEPDPGEVLGD